MSRLRTDLPDNEVDQLVRSLLEHTVAVVKNVGAEPIILTADNNITTQLYGCDVYYDEGRDLNSALDQAATEMKLTRVGLIMPDLPGLSEGVLSKFIRLVELHDYAICPTEDEGTAVAFLPSDFFSRGFFGNRSSSRIIDHANETSLSISKLVINDLLIDLDTLSDLNFWKEADTSIII